MIYYDVVTKRSLLLHACYWFEALIVRFRSIGL